MIYRNMTDEAYDAMPGVRASYLKTLWSQTPAHLSWKLGAGRQDSDSDALRVGRALHSAVLEPDDYIARYIRAPRVDRRTKEGKAKWQELEAAAGGRCILTEDEAQAVDGMCAQVFRTTAGSLLEFCDYRETVLTGTVFGVEAKCKIDAFDSDTGLVVDIKTCLSASQRAFRRAAVDYGYHLQMAFYRELLEQNDIRQLEGGATVLIAVEKTAPHFVALHGLTDGDIDRARALLPGLVAQYAECERTNTWPAYPTTVVGLALPDYAFNRSEISE